MKTKLFLILVFLSVNLFSQEKGNLFNLKIDDKEIGIKGCLGIAGKYSSFDSKPAGYMDFKASLIFDDKWGIGLAGSGLYYDKKLNKLVNDGTYHIYAGFGGLFVERIFHLNDYLMFNVGIISGYGEAYYKYDKEYLAKKVWYEEIIDQTTFFAIEPQIGFDFKLDKHLMMGITGSYCHTSPIKMIETDENMLNQFSGGISFKYVIF
jgi:hypothetical protein